MSIFYLYEKEFLNQALNKKALKQVEKVFKKDLNKLKKGFTNCFYKDFEKVEKALKNMFYKVLGNLKTHRDLINGFKWKYENNKIDKCLIFNISNYLLCVNMHNGGCNLCKNCYASQQELVTSNKDPSMFPSLYKWMHNYIYFTYLKYVKNSKLILYHTALRIRDFYLSRRVKPLFIRLNEKADLRDQEDLNNISFLSELLYQFIGLNTYSYTKTKNLRWETVTPHLRINKSKGLYNFEKVETIGAYYTSDTLEKTIYLLSHGVTPCYGACKPCGFKCGNLKSISRVCSIHGSKKLDLKGALNNE